MAACRGDLQRPFRVILPDDFAHIACRGRVHAFAIRQIVTMRRRQRVLRMAAQQLDELADMPHAGHCDVGDEFGFLDIRRRDDDT